MYGDTTAVRALAQEMRGQAADIRAESVALLDRAEAVRWTGLAADALRTLARDHAAALTASARAHDHAADLLEAHAREVDQVKALICAAERRVHAALESLAGRVSGLLRSRVGHWLSSFEPPPPGHLAWLDVRLPRWLP
jgi:hypothetical protein